MFQLPCFEFREIRMFESQMNKQLCTRLVNVVSWEINFRVPGIINNQMRLKLSFSITAINAYKHVKTWTSKQLMKNLFNISWNIYDFPMNTVSYFGFRIFLFTTAKDQMSKNVRQICTANEVNVFRIEKVRDVQEKNALNHVKG